MNSVQAEVGSVFEFALSVLKVLGLITATPRGEFLKQTWEFCEFTRFPLVKKGSSTYEQCRLHCRKPQFDFLSDERFVEKPLPSVRSERSYKPQSSKALTMISLQIVPSNTCLTPELGSRS